MAKPEEHQKIRLKLRDEISKNEDRLSSAKLDLEQAELNIKFLLRKQAAYYMLSMLSLWVKWSNEYRTMNAIHKYTMRKMGYEEKERT